MTWAATKEGYVNLATARSIRKTDDGPIVYDGNGECHHLIVTDDDVFRLRCSIVPATDRQTLIVIHVERDSGKIGENPEFRIEHYPIIGWSVDHMTNRAEPIIPGLPFVAHWTMAVIELPDGRFLEASRYVLRGKTFDTIDDAKQRLVVRVREREEMIRRDRKDKFRENTENELDHA